VGVRVGREGVGGLKKERREEREKTARDI